jgi:hypothetical protein
VVVQGRDVVLCDFESEFTAERGTRLIISLSIIINPILILILIQSIWYHRHGSSASASASATR